MYGFFFVLGRVPFIKCGAFLIAELDPIISFVNNKVNICANRRKRYDLPSFSPSFSLVFSAALHSQISNNYCVINCCSLVLDNSIIKTNLQLK
jgi:hypothetical protein